MIGVAQARLPVCFYRSNDKGRSTLRPLFQFSPCHPQTRLVHRRIIFTATHRFESTSAGTSSGIPGTPGSSAL